MINDRIEQRKQDKNRNSNTPAGVMPVNSPRKRQAFLDILLDEYDKGNISREGVREEVDTFMFEVSFNCLFMVDLKRFLRIKTVLLPLQ